MSEQVAMTQEERCTDRMHGVTEGLRCELKQGHREMHRYGDASWRLSIEQELALAMAELRDLRARLADTERRLEEQEAIASESMAAMAGEIADLRQSERDLKTRLAEANEENEVFETIFDLQRKREIEVWQQWYDQGKIPPDVLPDYGDQLLMLLEERDGLKHAVTSLKTRLAEAERERDEYSYEAALASNLPQLHADLAAAQERAQLAEKGVEDWQQTAVRHWRRARVYGQEATKHQERARTLEKALERYADHDGDCPAVAPVDTKTLDAIEGYEAKHAYLQALIDGCTCGFSAALAETADGAPEVQMERLAAAVHQAYLNTCARLGWPVKLENQVPYAELAEDSKELDRASVRAVLNALDAARAPEVT